MAEEIKSFFIGVQVSYDEVSNHDCTVFIAEERALRVNEDVVVERIFGFVGHGVIDDVVGHWYEEVLDVVFEEDCVSWRFVR